MICELYLHEEDAKEQHHSLKDLEYIKGQCLPGAYPFNLILESEIATPYDPYHSS